ncbi:MAG: DUF4230 domain-containing protein [Kineosporiaceae bacterium]
MPEEPLTEELATEFLDDDPAAADPSPVAPVPPSAGVPAVPTEAEHTHLVRHARDLDDGPRPGLLARLSGMALAVMIGIAGAILILTWLLGRTIASLNPFEESTIDRSGQSVLVTLNDLKTFQAASGYYEIVIDQEKDVENLPAILAGERVIFVAAGSVDATIDFAGIGAGSVTVNGDRTQAVIKLPAPQLGKARIDLDRSYIADHRRGLRERIQDAIDNSGGGVNTEQLYRTAEQRLTEAGTRTTELKDRARTNTRTMLTSLLGSLGFTTVTVSFGDET